ncbi:MAG TPA: tail fiber domain-containing protein [Sphingobacterium sp.]|nr:tail fiber domain-containing protein [Sphingobacterium sp.]
MKNIVGLFIVFFCVFQIASAQQIDERELKVNVQEISSPTEKVKNLEPVTFDFDVKKFKNLNLPEGNQYGFLTTNTKEKAPEIIKEETKAYSVGKNTSKVARFDGIDQDSLIPLLVAAVKEQQLQIERLQKELEELKKK